MQTKNVKLVFGLVFGGTLFFTGIIIYLVMRLPGVRESHLLGFLGACYVPIATITATLVCRRSGLSQGRVEMETLITVPNLDHSLLPAYEIRASITSKILCGLYVPIGIFLIALALRYTTPKGDEIYGYFMGGFFLFIGIWQGWVVYRGGYRVGMVSALGVGGMGRSAVVPWSKIASCEIKKWSNIFGSEVSPVFTFKSQKGFTLAQICVGDRPQDMESFESAVRAHFSSIPSPSALND